MTETGDYRYLDGVVSGSKMYLSAFDGAHAFLFNKKMLNQMKSRAVFGQEVIYHDMDRSQDRFFQLEGSICLDYI